MLEWFKKQPFDPETGKLVLPPAFTGETQEEYQQRLRDVAVLNLMLQMAKESKSEDFCDDADAGTN